MNGEIQSQNVAYPYELPPKPPAEAAHSEVSFEHTDTNVRMVVISLAIIGTMLLGTLTVTIFIQNYLRTTNPRGDLPSPLSPARVIPPGPLLDVNPAATYPLLRAQEDQILDNYGTDGQGHLRMPIGRAMDAVIPRLQVRPNAPPGITTPGGLDRRFAGSLDEMPNTQHGIAIEGEIQKHAQP